MFLNKLLIIIDVMVVMFLLVFIDFNKAFDNADYWLLFCKLTDSNDSISCFGATRLLAFWYSRQTVCVRWQNVHVCSAFFNVNKGVQQGGILSPYLFRFYICDLIISITSLNTGCNFAGTNVSLLAYADDIVLYSPRRGELCSVY